MFCKKLPELRYYLLNFLDNRKIVLLCKFGGEKFKATVLMDFYIKITASI